MTLPQSFTTLKGIETAIRQHAQQSILPQLALFLQLKRLEQVKDIHEVDPTIGEAPTDSLKGFLLPNLLPPEGDGFVNYSIKAKSTAATGSVIDAQARIIFDSNELIDTPAIFNTIDRLKIMNWHCTIP